MSSLSLFSSARRWCVGFLAALALLFVASAAQAQQREYVLLVGGPSLTKWEKYKREPHDNFWGSFVRAARTRVQLLRQGGNTDPITLLVFRDSYVTRGAQDGRDYVALVESIRSAFGVKIVWFSKSAEVFNYLNGGQPREAVKLSGFEFFGHSNKACFMFDYSNNIDSCAKVWMHEDELTRLRRDLFVRNAYVKSWGCHTGESMSRKFEDATGTRMIGAIGKTTYTNRVENRDGILNGIIPVLSGGKWTNG